MRVIEIVKERLVTDGFDGLVAPHADCGCLCDDLAPCSSDFGQCEPGYRGMHADEPGEWAIYRTKEAARESCALARSNTPNDQHKRAAVAAPLDAPVRPGAGA